MIVPHKVPFITRHHLLSVVLIRDCVRWEWRSAESNGNLINEVSFPFIVICDVFHNWFSSRQIYLIIWIHFAMPFLTFQSSWARRANSGCFALLVGASKYRSVFLMMQTMKSNHIKKQSNIWNQNWWKSIEIQLYKRY